MGGGEALLPPPFEPGRGGPPVISKDEELRHLGKEVLKHMHATVDRLTALRQDYLRYSFLWTTPAGLGPPPGTLWAASGQGCPIPGRLLADPSPNQGSVRDSVSFPFTCSPHSRGFP